MFAFLLTCTCCQILQNCSEPPSSSTSYPHTMKELRDKDEAIRNDVPSSQRKERKRRPSVLPQSFITRHYQRCAVSRGIQEAQGSGSMQRFTVGFPIVDDWTALILPRRALRRIVSSSQTSFPVRSKCLRASSPADGSAFVIESAGISGCGIQRM